jgi:sensor c-di-GMP phosphodiesterase-like protein
MDISLAQGYWYGRPLPADTFSAWLKQQPDEMKARKKQ